MLWGGGSTNESGVAGLSSKVAVVPLLEISVTAYSNAFVKTGLELVLNVHTARYFLVLACDDRDSCRLCTNTVHANEV
jgi:hypothetical protein